MDMDAFGDQFANLARFCEASGGFGDGIDSALNPLEPFQALSTVLSTSGKISVLFERT